MPPESKAGRLIRPGHDSRFAEDLPDGIREALKSTNWDKRLEAAREARANALAERAAQAATEEAGVPEQSPADVVASDPAISTDQRRRPRVLWIATGAVAVVAGLAVAHSEFAPNPSELALGEFSGDSIPLVAPELSAPQPEELSMAAFPAIGVVRVANSPVVSLSAADPDGQVAAAESTSRPFVSSATPASGYAPAFEMVRAPAFFLAGRDTRIDGPIPAQSSDETAAIAGLVEPASPSRERQGVRLFAPNAVSDDALDRVSDLIGDAGFDTTATGRVRFAVSEDQVRFYHPDDRAPAEELAASIGAQLRDFTARAPSDAPGTVEVWMSGESTGRSRGGVGVSRARNSLNRALSTLFDGEGGRGDPFHEGGRANR